jgi:SsrA-binding protein
MAKSGLQKNVSIKNRKAYFNYEILDKFICGLQLMGTEIKSIRLSKVSLPESFCYTAGGEVFVKGMTIAQYENATHYNHQPDRVRKLLLNKKEIEKIKNKLKDQALTIIPTKLFINDRGFAKMEIGIARGKKLHDKRDSIKDKDVKRDLQKQKLL